MREWICGMNWKIALRYIHNHVLHFIVQQKLTAETNTTLYSNYPPIKKKILREMKKFEKVKEVMCEENETR